MGAFFGGGNNARRLGSGAGNSRFCRPFKLLSPVLHQSASAHALCHDYGMQILGQRIQFANIFMAVNNFQGGIWMINGVITRTLASFTVMVFEFFLFIVIAPSGTDSEKQLRQLHSVQLVHFYFGQMQNPAQS
jgi:uncharacterized membrane protein YphA (DoxX/SURF4 family)